jgi:hypothetical protein
MSKMRVVQITEPKGSLELVERGIPEPAAGPPARATTHAPRPPSDLMSLADEVRGNAGGFGTPLTDNRISRGN